MNILEMEKLNINVDKAANGVRGSFHVDIDTLTYGLDSACVNFRSEKSRFAVEVPVGSSVKEIETLVTDAVLG